MNLLSDENYNERERDKAKNSARLTRQSCDPVARSPSWNGEKSISVTVSVWAWSRGIVLLLRPQSSIGRTARLEPAKVNFLLVI